MRRLRGALLLAALGLSLACRKKDPEPAPPAPPPRAFSGIWLTKDSVWILTLKGPDSTIVRDGQVCFDTMYEWKLRGDTLSIYQHDGRALEATFTLQEDPNRMYVELTGGASGMAQRMGSDPGTAVPALANALRHGIGDRSGILRALEGMSREAQA